MKKLVSIFSLLLVWNLSGKARKRVLKAEKGDEPADVSVDGRPHHHHATESQSQLTTMEWQFPVAATRTTKRLWVVHSITGDDGSSCLPHLQLSSVAYPCNPSERSSWREESSILLHSEDFFVGRLAFLGIPQPCCRHLISSYLSIVLSM